MKFGQRRRFVPSEGRTEHGNRDDLGVSGDSW